LQSKNKKFKKELVVKSSTDNLAQIREFTQIAAQESGFSNENVGKIVLAVDEACTNIIKHAYKYSPVGDINISVRLEQSKFIISIIDEGGHFNPDIIPEPDIREYHKKRKAGGLGMYLMKKLMDEVKYTNLNENRNQVILVKYLT